MIGDKVGAVSWRCNRWYADPEGDTLTETTMAKVLTPSEVAAILKGGTFDDLKGMLEDESLECKAAPYQLQHESKKYELAKDVSMIVNRSARTGRDGGHILLGVRTERSPEHHTDLVVDVSPFKQHLVDPKQYYDVLHDWLVPVPEGLNIRWYASRGDSGRGIVAITIPRQPPDRWPCLITKVLDGSGKARGVSVAYFERQGEHGVEWTPPDLQRILRDGARADVTATQIEALSQRVSALESAIQEQLAKAIPAPTAVPEPSQALLLYKDRRGAAVTAAGLRAHPVYALTAAPAQGVSLPTLFRGSDDPLVKLLTHPPSLRHAGFGVTLRDDLTIVRGELRRALLPGVGLLECWPDGTLIFVVETTNFLCWGDKTRGNVLRINPLALAESTYLFATLAHRIYIDHATPPPKVVEFGLALERVKEQGKVAVLSEGGVNSFGYRFGMNVKEAPEAGAEFCVRAEELWTPGEVAYQLTAAVYRWFGHTDASIPYADEENGVRVISEKRILKDSG